MRRSVKVCTGELWPAKAMNYGPRERDKERKAVERGKCELKSR
jgi:hypothetical protein